MSLLDCLSDTSVWQCFYEYKKEKAHLSKEDDEFFRIFLKEQSYLPLASRVKEEGFCFDYPEKKLVNKMETGKKRVVYSFRTEENMLLKLLSYQLYRYDEFFPENLYSFRKNFGVLRAFKTMTGGRRTDSMYGYKVDVSNYFNSIDTGILITQLQSLIKDDEALYCFLSELLSADRSYSEGHVISEKRGAMAGIPVSPFFANLYLTELDRYFLSLRQEGILYARYSDDILLFAKTEERRNECIQKVKEFLTKYRLTVNPSKEELFAPHQKWDFLGISYEDGKTDLSEATVKKMQGKIRRKARALYRWGNSKGVTTEQKQKVMIRIFNDKFFEYRDSHELNWSQWFFPMISESKGLHRLDLYLQQYIRFLTTGRFTKGNYRTGYEDMKTLGYRSLVHEYYKYRGRVEEERKTEDYFHGNGKNREEGS